MRTTILILAVVIFNALSMNVNAQLKPLTDKEKEKLKTFKSIDQAKENADAVEALFLNYAKLTEFPKEMSLFKKMIIFDLGGNSIKEIPVFIFDLTNIQEFGISHNQISVIPVEISKLKNLVAFKMWNNQITKVPDELLSLPNLQVLELKGNPIPKEEKDRIKKKFPKLKILF